MEHSGHSRHRPRRNATLIVAGAVLAAIVATGCVATTMAPGARPSVARAARRGDDVRAVTYHDLFAAPVRLGLDDRAVE
jgi:hypothetical protein